MRAKIAGESAAKLERMQIGAMSGIFLKLSAESCTGSRMAKKERSITDRKIDRI